VFSRDDVQDLADAILLGVERREQQSFGTYFGPEGGSCALGAAYEGIYRLPDDVAGQRRSVWTASSIASRTSRGAVRPAAASGCPWPR
jgi:hypothetical protein